MPSRQPAPARTIEEVIVRLDVIIARATSEQSRLGYFAALYRTVTVAVRAGIAAGRFEDGPRMERLDVAFANRYLVAYDEYRAGQATDPCWQVAFDAANRWRPIILQHLLLGMNAHINYDLGVAAAETCPGDALPGLERDFTAINAILSALVDDVKAAIGEVSPWIRLLDHIDPQANDAIINFSMVKARGAAWTVATRLAPLERDAWDPHLVLLNAAVTTLAAVVRHPVGTLLRLALLVVRVRESNDARRVIQVLGRTAARRS